jgi:hypothetical protein
VPLVALDMLDEPGEARPYVAFLLAQLLAPAVLLAGAIARCGRWP